MNNQTLRYYMHDGPSAFRFELAGALTDEAARRLDQDWQTASSVIGDRALIIDMTFVTSAETDGRSLFARWHAAGARIIAESKASRELAEAIIGESLPGSTPAANSSADRTWLPFHTSSGRLRLMLLIAAVLPLQSHATNLQNRNYSFTR
jgi:hypothetical protein